MSESKTKVSEMEVVRINRLDVQKYRDMDYTIVEDSESADGRAHYGDAVLMQIPREIFLKHKADVREPYEDIRNNLRRGESPIGISEHAHARFIFNRESSKGTMGRKRGEG